VVAGVVFANEQPEAHVIVLSRLNGQVVAINPDLVCWIEVLPDTTVSMVGGDKIIVRESLEEVIARIIAYRSAIGKVEALHPTSHAAALAAARAAHKSSSFPPPRSLFPVTRSDAPPPRK
jgi:flagellar protein FlbD